MLKKLIAWLKRKDEEIASLKEERDSYMAVMTEAVQDANDTEKAYRTQTCKWEQAEKQLSAVRACNQDYRVKILLLEKALIQSERDYEEMYKQMVKDDGDHRDVFIAAYKTILTVLINTARDTDLPVPGLPE